MDDEGAVDTLLSARQSGDRDGIEWAYALPSYQYEKKLKPPIASVPRILKTQGVPGS